MCTSDYKINTRGEIAMMDDPILLKASSELAIATAKNTTQKVLDRLKVVKERNDDKASIATLFEIVYELIDQKDELTRIAKIYDEQLVAQKITDDELIFIAEHLIPTIEKLIAESTDYEDLEGQLEVLKALLSKETLSILQLIGFNFKQAIGEPLTILIRELILSKLPLNNDQNIEMTKLQTTREIEWYKFLQNPEAYTRFIELRSGDSKE